MSCLLCKQSKSIYFSDYCYKFGQINLCFDCTGQVMPEECKGSRVCPRCKENKSFKFDWQKICTACWRKEKNGTNS